MNDQARLAHFTAATQALRPAVTLKAWRIMPASAGNPRLEAEPVSLPDWIETAEDAAKIACSALMHKASILVLRSDAAEREERRNVLSTFVVRRKSNPGWVRGPDGRPVREHPEYPELVMQVRVFDGFSPVEPWRVGLGADVVGIDRALVEQG